MNKVIGHFRTITKHRHKVITHCFKCGIPIRGLLHDLSKYSPCEFRMGCKYFTDGKRSPTERERLEVGYSMAWLHHKGRNRHHFEYWNDLNPKEGRYMPCKMPLKYVIEMYCDRLAASKIYMGKDYTNSHPYEYFINAKARRQMHPETSDFLEMLLLMTKEKGEKETFKFIRNYLKNNKSY